MHFLLATLSVGTMSVWTLAAAILQEHVWLVVVGTIPFLLLPSVNFLLDCCTGMTLAGDMRASSFTPGSMISLFIDLIRNSRIRFLGVSGTTTISIQFSQNPGSDY